MLRASSVARSTHMPGHRERTEDQPCGAASRRRRRRAVGAGLALVLARAASGAEPADGADPGVRDAAEFDPRRPPAAELAMEVADGFSIAAVGDLIISRPLSQQAQALPRFGKAIELLRTSDVAY